MKQPFVAVSTLHQAPPRRRSHRFSHLDKDTNRGSHLGLYDPPDSKEITQVEVSTDNGLTWKHARILNHFKPNVWKHWKYEWDVEAPGDYTIFARVTDTEGNVQNEDGLYGWWGYKVEVTASVEIDCINRKRADVNQDWYVDFIDFSLTFYQWEAT